MPEDKDNPFYATMRIEIPPDLEAQSEAAKGAPPAARKPPTRRIIRISKTATEADTLGGQDFQALLQNIYDAVLITDLHGQILNINVRARLFFGYESAEFTRLNVLQVISGATEDLLPTIRQTLQSDRFVLMQACCNRKDGSFFPAEISVNRLRLSSTEYLNFFVRDVTLRKEAEERLKTSDTAIRNAGSGIAIMDTDGNVQYCNPAMLRLWGLDDEDAHSCNIRDFLADPRLADEIDLTMQKGGAWSREMIMKRRDGGTFFAQVSAAPNVKPDGALAGTIMSLLDISNLKRAQSQLAAYADELKEKNALFEEDLKMAKEVQMAFLPRDYPEFRPGAGPGGATLKFCHLYHPSGAVGGDFFDVIRLSDTQAGVFIADVVGHGMRAALVVATTRGLIEQLQPIAGDPGAFLTQLNQAYAAIFRNVGECMFATAFYCVVDIPRGKMLLTNAGHPPPFRLRRDRGVVEKLRLGEGSKGPGLGLFESSVYTSEECPLDPNDALLLYTDGLSEATSPEGEYYDTQRMGGFLSEYVNLSPPELLPGLLADAQAFSQRVEFDDDVCLLALELLRTDGPPGGPKPPRIEIKT